MKKSSVDVSTKRSRFRNPLKALGEVLRSNPNMSARAKKTKVATAGTSHGNGECDDSSECASGGAC